MTDREVFTLEAANALVPRLRDLVGRQLERRTDIETRLKELSIALGEVPEEIVFRASDPEDVRGMKTALAKRIGEYQAGWREVEQLGAVVKDPRVGLLDFYGQVDGKLVWLCWKYGEPEIAYFHSLEEGFSGRKPIRNSIRHRLLN